MRIAVDLDDTLSRVARRELAAEYIKRKGLPFKLAQPDSAEFVKIYDWSYEDATRFIKDGGIVAFTDAEARKGARETLAAWRAAGHEVVILTGRFKEWFPNPVLISRDWLEKRHIPYDEIVAEIPFGEKGRYCLEHGIGILVDDNVEACLGAQENGVTAVLAIGRHNAARAHEVLYGGANWEQIGAAVKHILAMGV